MIKLELIKLWRLAFVIISVLLLSSCGSAPSGGGTAATAPTSSATTLGVLSFTNTVQTAASSSTSTVTTTVIDAAGNPVAGAIVSFNVAGSGNIVAGALQTNATVTAVSNANGVATAIITYDPGNPPTVTATTTGSTGAVVTSAQSVTAPLVAATIKLSSPVTRGLVADGKNAYTVTAQVLDAYSTGLVGMPISFSNTGSGLVILTSSALVTGAGGVVTLTVTDIYTADETVNISATSGAVTTSAALSLTFVGSGTGGAGGGANAGNVIAVTANVNGIPADSYTFATITAVVTDGAGVAVANLPLTITTTGSAVPSIAAVTTDAYGKASFTIKDSIGETVKITVSDKLSNGVLSQIFIPAVAKLTVTVSNPTVLSDGTSAATLVISAKDAQGRGVTGETLSVSSDSYTAFVPNIAVTDQVAGQATVQIRNTTSEIVNITVTSRNGGTQLGKPQFGTAAVTFVTPNIQISIPANQNFLADGTAKAFIVAVTDQNGKPQTGRDVTLSVTGSAILSSLAAKTDNAGNLAVTIKDTAAELVTFTVSDSIGTSTRSQSIQFVASTPTQLVVDANPLTVTPDGVTSAAITATVRNAAGQPVQNAFVALSTTDPYALLAQSTFLTNISGQVFATAVSNSVTTATITATLTKNASQTGSRVVTFEQPVGILNLTSDKVSVAADGGSIATITAEVLDAGSAPLVGRIVTFTNTGNATLVVATNVTDAAGRVVVTLKDSYAEVSTVAASIAGFSQNLAVTFNPVVANIQLAAPVTTGQIANGTASYTVIAKLVDKNSLPIQGQPLTFNISGYLGLVIANPQQGISDKNGIVTTVITDVSAANDTVTVGASSGLVNAGSSVRVAFIGSTTAAGGGGISTGNIITVSSNVDNLPADNYVTATINVNVLDPYQVAAANVPMTLTALNVTGGIDPAVTINPAGSSNTDIYGNVSFTVKSLSPGSFTLKVSDGTSSSTLLQTFIRAVNTISVNPVPKTLLADGVSTSLISIVVKDAYGFAVTNEKLIVAASGAGQASVGAVVTDASGTASITVKDAVAETVTIDVYSRNGILGSGLVQHGTAKVSFVTSNIQIIISPAGALKADNLTNNLALTAPGAAAGRIFNLVLTGSAQATAALSTNVGVVTAAGDIYTSEIGGVPITIKDTVAETLTLIVTDDLGANTASSSIQFVDGAADSVVMIATPANVAPDGLSTATITAQVTAKGAAVANAVVDFSINTVASPTAVLSASRVLTDTAGVAKVTITNTTAQITDVYATLSLNGNIQKFTSIVFEQPVASLALVSDVTSLITDSYANISATILDGNGQPLVGRTVS
ncbi:MAG: Ig-like domain-containing protein, partial [Mariprofundaceae bacterium]|nr:Ig-like domain-containing protein [Mariprofundaceae bacterium]